MSIKTSAFISALALLASKVAADSNLQCVLKPNPPAGTNCGTKGYLRNEYSLDTYSVDADIVATPQACAAACAARGNCVSFYYGDNSYPFCEYHTDTTAAAEFYSYAGSYYYGYDEACFTCNPRTITCPDSDGQQYTAANGEKFNVHCNTDYYGGDLDHANVDTLQQCLDACSTTSGCVAVALNGNNCYLKSSAKSPSSNSNVQGAVLASAEPVAALTCPGSNGATYTTKNGEAFQVQCGTDYYGNDLSAPYVDNLNDCLDACGSTSGCVGVAMHGNYCYLKSALSNAQQSSDVWGAALISSPADKARRDNAAAAGTLKKTPGVSKRR